MGDDGERLRYERWSYFDEAEAACWLDHVTGKLIYQPPDTNPNTTPRLAEAPILTGRVLRLH